MADKGAPAATDSPPELAPATQISASMVLDVLFPTLPRRDPSRSKDS
jgi:hypothetical protein